MILKHLAFINFTETEIQYYSTIKFKMHTINRIVSILITLYFNCLYFLANCETGTISLLILIANKVLEMYSDYYVRGINCGRILPYPTDR